MALDNNTGRNWIDKTTIKNWFKRGLKPTQEQFWSTWDSFWHKDEKLPISSIDKLGDLLDGKAEENHTHSEYATNDATSLTAENVTAWQKKLGVDDLDYVDIPTEDASVESHPYVVVIDNEGNSARRNATDFGKVDTIDGIEADENKDVKLGAVRKSESNEVEAGFDLYQKDGAYVSIDTDGMKVSKGGIYSIYKPESIKPVNQVPSAAYQFQEILYPKRSVISVEEKVYHITYINGVKSNENGRADIWGIANNWTNPHQQFSALEDKSNDATYNIIPIMNNVGNVAKATQLGNVFENGLKNVSAEQSLRIGQLLNGGIGSSGMMAVNMISPPYIKLANEDTYVVLRGANLYLNIDNYNIDITDISGNSVANIPNSQIQLRASGIELVFYYNFSLLGQGTYKLKIVSGAKILYTTLSFEVVQNMEVVNLSATTWEVLEKNGNQSTASVISPTAITLNRLVNDTTTYLPTISAKSSPIFASHEDWMLEYEVNFKMNLGSGSPGPSKTIAGVDYQSIQHNLIQSGIAYAYWVKLGSAGHISFAQFLASPNQPITTSEQVGGGGSNHDHNITLNVTLVKTGNMITVNSNGQTSTNVVTNGEAYCFLAQISGRQTTNSESMSVRFLNAYKFNK